jgi:hypothetical protein
MRSLLCTALAVASLVAATSSQAEEPKWLLPSGDQLNGSKAVIENTPCCEGSRDAGVANSDQAVLAKMEGQASRAGRVLSLKLAGSRTLRLTDCDEAGGCAADDTRLHRLVGWWPKYRFYVVSVDLSEDASAYLIAERDGRTLVTTAPPVLSPNGRQAVALTSNMMSGVDLQVIDLTRDPPTLAEITTMPACSGNGPDSFLRPLPVWADDTHVTFEGEQPLPDEKPGRQMLRVEGGKGEWQC